MTVRPDDVVQVADGVSLPQVGVVLTGDALVTGHPDRGPPRPPLLPGFSSSDPEQAVTALDALARLDADVVLPGHGPAAPRPGARRRPPGTGPVTGRTRSAAPGRQLG